jgi:hypothetical protein
LARRAKLPHKTNSVVPHLTNDSVALLREIVCTEVTIRSDGESMVDKGDNKRAQVPNEWSVRCEGDALGPAAVLERRKALISDVGLSRVQKCNCRGEPMARRYCKRVLRVNAGRIGINKKSSYNPIGETSDEFAHRCQFTQTATSRLIVHSGRCRAESCTISQSTLAKSDRLLGHPRR